MKTLQTKWTALLRSGGGFGILWMVLLSSVSPAQVPETGWLKQLQSPDLDSQREALIQLATSLDPRIPDACLPLLKSPGTSIRRNAARAIGSRWHQIPKERTNTFVEALKVNLNSPEVGLANMSRRGIALLDRTYDNAMFSRSKNRRWVVYERFGKPCLIDTRNHTEELLGAGAEGKFLPAYGNGEVAPHCFWHPKQDMAAMDILIFRGVREIWVWRHGARLRLFQWKELSGLLAPAKGEVVPGFGIYMTVVRWKGEDLEFTVNYTARIDESTTDHTTLLRWDPATDKVRVLEDAVEATPEMD